VSKESKQTKRRKSPEIPDLEMKPEELAGTQRIVGRLIGRGAPAKSSAPEETSPPAKVDGEPLQISAAEKISGAIAFTRPEQHTRIPNELLDELLPTLRPSEQSVLLRLYRLTWGFQKDSCWVSMGKLAKACNLSSRQVTTCVHALEKRKIIRRLETDFSNRNQSERGVLYQILLPPVPRAKSSGAANFSPAAKSSAPAKISANKEKSFIKENIKKDPPQKVRLTPEQIAEQAQLISELIKSGYTLPQAEAQFAGGLDPADWQAIRAQLGEKGTK